jgi:hypothetical protein
MSILVFACQSFGPIGTRLLAFRASGTGSKGADFTHLPVTDPGGPDPEAAGPCTRQDSNLQPYDPIRAVHHLGPLTRSVCR